MIPNRKSSDIFKDVRTFIELAQPEMITELGQKPKLEMLKLLQHIVHEEVNKEFFPLLEKMLENGNASLEQQAELLDHMLDSIYVLAWGIAAMSLPGQAGWNEVQRANMSKFPTDAQVPRYNFRPLDIPEYAGIEYTITERNGHQILTNKETGKIMKPVKFIPPDILGIVYSCINIMKLRTMPDVLADISMREYFHEIERRRERGEADL